MKALILRIIGDGNFLETVLLVAKSDLIFKEHLNKIVEKSAARLKEKKIKGERKVYYFYEQKYFFEYIDRDKKY